MAINLTYNNDLGRVQIALTGLSQDAVRIERSTNELHWEIARGGVDIPVHDGQVDLDDYEFAVNTETFYRVLDVEDLEGAAVEADSITTALGDCEVWLKSIRYPLLNFRDDRLMDYSDLTIAGRSGVFDISGRSFPVAVTDVATSFRFEITVNTESPEDVRRVSLLLALGDVLYLQVPPDGNPQLPPRSMYCVADGSTQQRFAVGDKRYTRAPLVEVAAPGPDVVGTTLTWQTVWNQYADWTSLWNANPSWRDLLETVGSGEDLVVI